MANTINLGLDTVSTIKIGADNVDAVYVGDVLVYSGGTPPTPPTPTYKWVSYSEGDEVPSATVYGVKLENGSSNDGSIEFGNGHSGIAFICESGEWSALEVGTGDEIDISSYYDEGTYTYTILFSDLGYSGMPISYPIEGDTLQTDIDLYEEDTPTPQTLQWVEFTADDTIPSTLKVYGISGDSEGLMDTFSDSTEPFYVEPYRRTFDIYLMNRYYEQTNNVNYIFSDMTWYGLGDYINFNTDKTVRAFPFKLYIYA